VTCGCCGVFIPSGRDELCWYCEGPLCADCWELEGHCGHPEADALNEVADALWINAATLSEALVIA